MIARRALLVMTAFAALGPVAAWSQKAPRVYRIGFLHGGSAPATRGKAAFLSGMRALGYEEGRDFMVESRFADFRPERYAAIAAELVQLKVDVIVASGGAGSVRAAQKATRTIPIVMQQTADPVGDGLVASLARPGGNVTGSSNLSPVLVARQLQILTAVVPNLSSVAFLTNPGNPSTSAVFRSAEAAVQQLKLSIVRVDVPDAAAFESSFGALARHRVGAVMVPLDSLFNAHQKAIADLALKNRLPSIASRDEFARDGALVAYGPSYLESFARAAVYVDKILKGAKAGDLPVEQPTKFELVVNLKAAKALGITIPQAVLLQASRVIE